MNWDASFSRSFSDFILPAWSHSSISDLRNMIRFPLLWNGIWWQLVHPYTVCSAGWLGIYSHNSFRFIHCSVGILCVGLFRPSILESNSFNLSIIHDIALGKSSNVMFFSLILLLVYCLIFRQSNSDFKYWFYGATHHIKRQQWNMTIIRITYWLSMPIVENISSGFLW